MEHLVPKRITLDLVQFGDLLERWWVLRNQGTFLQQRNLVGHVGLIGEVLNIAEKGIARNTSQRVLDSIRICEPLVTAWKDFSAIDRTWQ